MGIRPEDVKAHVAKVKSGMSAKIISKAGVSVIRCALYNAKLALEQDFDGADRDAVLRTIVEALDVTAKLVDAP